MTVEKDVCPECGRDWVQKPRPDINPPDGYAHPSGGLGSYTFLEGRDVYLRIEIECPDCDWTYKGELQFERIE